MMSPSFLYAILTFLLLLGCSNKNDNGNMGSGEAIVAKYDTLNGMQSFEVPDVLPYEVSFIKEAEYSSSEKIILGSINRFTVDHLGRVFIANGRKLELFDFEGKFVRTIGRNGRGPGEFSNMSFLNPKIYSSWLYVYDDVLSRINIFDIETLQFSHSVKVNVKNILRQVPKMVSVDEITMISENLFIVRLREPYDELENGGHQRFITIDEKGEVVSEVFFSYKEHPSNSYLVIDLFGGEKSPAPPRTVYDSYTKVEFDNDHYIYTSNGEDFLIKVYAPDGKHDRSIHYPFDNAKFEEEDLENILVNELSSKNKGPVDLDIPKLWPAIHQFFVDDEKRIWVGTITDDTENYEWWILDSSGELISKFNWPGERMKRNARISGTGTSVVKNNFFYSIESDESTKLNKIVKYRIEIKGVKC